MKSLKDLIDVCYEFKDNAFSIEEFQHKIETVLLPDDCKNTLEKQKRNACNRLEVINYCYIESRKKYVDQVADELIQATFVEQERLKEYTR
jgi:hypothetical protein